MNRVFSICAVIALFALSAVSGQAQSLQGMKIGLVNSQTLIKALPEFEKVTQQVEQLQQRYIDTLSALRKEYDRVLEGYNQQATMMTPEQRQTAEQDVNRRSQIMQQYQQQTLGTGGTLAVYQAQLVEPIREKILKAIQVIAERNKLSGVMEMQSFLYADPKLEITYDVLKYLNSGQ